MSRKATFRAERTRQVQFRMDPDKVKRLLAAIAFDDDMHSMADLFNKAADEYLERQEKNGGKYIGEKNKLSYRR